MTMLLNVPVLVDWLVRLLAIPSPSGFTASATSFLQAELALLGVESRLTRKGALLWTLPAQSKAKKSSGQTEQSHQARALLAHTDTLGAMVKEIKHNGRLKLSLIGGFDWANVEGEYCWLSTNSGRVITGTIVNTKQSTHVYGNELRDIKRGDATMELRLDEVVRNAAEVKALGISVGDFVCFDPRTTVTDSGYIKSRFLDNKAAVAVFLAVTKAVIEEKLKLSHETHFIVTSYEEVGHGAAGVVAANVVDMLAVDMAAVGDGQTSSEHCVTLCVKDSGGPYDHRFGQELRQLATNADIDLRTDIYPFYTSDATAAWHAGVDARAALIGPGVDASHAYERTHIDALKATGDLILAWLVA
jgi:putative aminopeptidase FrvX